MRGFAHPVLIGIILISLVGLFLVSRGYFLQPHSKVISTQKIADNVTFQKKLSLEKTQDNKYQPTLQLKLTKPKNQKLTQKIIIIEKIPKEFAQDINQLTFTIPPTLILEKDPLIVWKFDEIESGESVNYTYDVSPQDLEEILKEQQIPEEKKTEIQNQTKEYLEVKPKPDQSAIASLIDWILGKVEEFNIIMQRDPLGLTEAEKVYTETSVMLAGKAPPVEENVNPPLAYPGGLSLAYPGAVAREKIPYVGMWSDEPGNPTCLVTRYDLAEASSTVVAKWYYDKLTAAGWKYQGQFNEQEYTHYFAKDKNEVRVILAPGGPNIIGISPKGVLIHFCWRKVGEQNTSVTIAPTGTEEELPLYPGAKRFYTKEKVTLNKCIAAWPESLCPVWKTYTVANVAEETVSRWYYDTLTSAGWQFGKTHENYVWESISYTPINPHFYLKGDQIMQIFFHGTTVFEYCLSQVKKPLLSPTPK